MKSHTHHTDQITFFTFTACSVDPLFFPRCVAQRRDQSCHVGALHVVPMRQLRQFSQPLSHTRVRTQCVGWQKRCHLQNLLARIQIGHRRLCEALDERRIAQPVRFEQPERHMDGLDGARNGCRWRGLALHCTDDHTTASMMVREVRTTHARHHHKLTQSMSSRARASGCGERANTH